MTHEPEEQRRARRASAGTSGRRPLVQDAPARDVDPVLEQLDGLATRLERAESRIAHLERRASRCEHLNMRGVVP